jgi:hypothetical protein
MATTQMPYNTLDPQNEVRFGSNGLGLDLSVFKPTLAENSLLLKLIPTANQNRLSLGDNISVMTTTNVTPAYSLLVNERIRTGRFGQAVKSLQLRKIGEIFLAPNDDIRRIGAEQASREINVGLAKGLAQRLDLNFLGLNTTLPGQTTDLTTDFSGSLFQSLTDMTTIASTGGSLGVMMGLFGAGIRPDTVLASPEAFAEMMKDVNAAGQPAVQSPDLINGTFLINGMRGIVTELLPAGVAAFFSSRLLNVGLSSSDQWYFTSSDSAVLETIRNGDGSAISAFEQDKTAYRGVLYADVAPSSDIIGAYVNYLGAELDIAQGNRVGSTPLGADGASHDAFNGYNTTDGNVDNGINPTIENGSFLTEDEASADSTVNAD